MIAIAICASSDHGLFEWSRRRRHGVNGVLGAVMFLRLQWLIALIVICAAASTLTAQEQLLRQRVDAEVRAAWQREKVTPAPKSDDATFLRRVYLDLAGGSYARPETGGLTLTGPAGGPFNLTFTSGTLLPVTSATDITGFGLAGHLFNVARASKAEIEIYADALPLMPGKIRQASGRKQVAGI